MKRLRLWHLPAAAYMAAVAVCATINQAAAGESWWWYGASMILTLPLSLFATYPILFIAGSVSEVTGGGHVAGNAYGSAVVVCAFVGMAAVNVLLCRAVCLMSSDPERGHVST